MTSTTYCEMKFPTISELRAAAVAERPARPEYLKRVQDAIKENISDGTNGCITHVLDAKGNSQEIELRLSEVEILKEAKYRVLPYGNGTYKIEW